MSYADSFGNKFQFDATIKNIYINCKNASTRYTALSFIGITICYLSEMIKSWPII